MTDITLLLRNRLLELHGIKQNWEEDARKCPSCIKVQEDLISDTCEFHRERLLEVNACIEEVKFLIRLAEKGEDPIEEVLA